MDNLQDNTNQGLTEEDEIRVAEIEDASDTGLYSEELLHEVLKSYKEAWNKQNDKYEVDFHCTLTTHKQATQVGNVDVAYLRLERAVRSKQAQIEDPNIPQELKLPEWKVSLIHTEAYPFKNMQERLNPKARWKDYLFQSCLARLIVAGIEYAELLQRMKNMNLEEERAKQNDTKLDLVITDKMPKALSPDEMKYKEEITKLRQSENN